MAKFKKQAQQVTSEDASVISSAVTDVKENKSKHIRTKYFVHVGNNRISELEVKAKETFHYLAYIYLMLMTPTLISLISALICLQVSSSSCSLVLVPFYHIGVLMSCLHSGIANPVAFVLLSKDLLSCLKSRARQNKSVLKQTN